MEKIKLKNGQLFDLVPMGINVNEKRRSFQLTTELTYSEIETLFTNTDNISSVQYLSEAGETLVTYADCVGLKTLSKDIETGIFTVELSIDAVERKMVEMQAQIDALTAAQTV